MLGRKQSSWKGQPSVKTPRIIGSSVTLFSSKVDLQASDALARKTPRYELKVDV